MQRKSQHGFTLVELAVLVLITGIVMATLVSMIPGQDQRADRVATKSHLAEIVDGIEAYVARNGHLPCVASRSELPNTANYGRQVLANCVTDTSMPAGTERINVGGGAYIRLGVVPTRDLLLSDRYMADEYGNRYTYVVMEGLTSAASFAASAGKLTILDGDGGTLTAEAGYAVLSHGKDGKGAYRELSGALKVACGASANLDVENCDGDATFRAASYSESTVEASFFDDFIHYATKTMKPCFRVDGAAPGDGLAANANLFEASFGNVPLASTFITGDVNGDGYRDVITRSSSANANIGAVYVVFGGPAGIPLPLLVTELDGSNGFRLDGGPGTPYWIGLTLGSGDINDDGFDDIFLMAPRNVNHNDVYVVFGKAGGWAASSLLTTYADGTQGFKVVWEVGELGAHNLAAEASGDINGDGIDDLLVSSIGNAGDNVYVIFGKASGWASTIVLPALNGTDGFRIIGPEAVHNLFGERDLVTGDINNDGYDDVIIPKPWLNHHGFSVGSVYVVFGKTSWGASIDATALDGSNGFRLDGGTYCCAGFGDPYFDSAGAAIDSADMNNDGFDDLVIGVPFGQVDNFLSGDTHVIYGKAGGWAASALITSFANGTDGYVIYGDFTSHQTAGFAKVGNVNNDAYPDFLISAPDYEDPGDVYVVFGKQIWPATTALTSLADGSQGFALLHSGTTGDRASAHSGLTWQDTQSCAGCFGD